MDIDEMSRYLYQTYVMNLQVGVALLGGFGDLNVERNNQGADAAGKDGSSTALALKPSALLRLKVPELKQKLKSAGVDLAKHPAAVEKKVRRCFSPNFSRVLVPLGVACVSCVGGEICIYICQVRYLNIRSNREYLWWTCKFFPSDFAGFLTYLQC